ncbi:MAG: branched-chain amino acid transporter permease [Homoserinimonas sp.]|nr:branched-chain amino acid transporter permease [Homoserinimonas sp.]
MRAVRSTNDTAAIRQGVSVSLAVSAYGVSFGALAVTAGLDIWQACVLSLLMFSGGSQFALIGVVASGGVAAGPAAIASAVLLGSRNSLYAMRMAPVLGGGWLRRAAASHLTIDESTAVATAQPTLRSQKVGFWVTGILIYVGWNITTLVGAIVGDALGDVSRFGLDAAAAAAFLGLLWPRLSQLQPVVVAIAAAFVAALLTPWVPAGIPVLAAAAVALLVGLTNWWGMKPEEAADVDVSAAAAGKAQS